MRNDKPPREFVERRIHRWLDEFVAGLDLCPFARPLLGASNLRISVCQHSDPEALLQAFLVELDRLQTSPEDEVATTLLAFSHALDEFDDYLEYLSQAQDLLEASGLGGLVQLASFHPHYRFEGEEADAASQYSNRAPYPLVHLLRESMLTRVLADYPDPQRIPARNMETLNNLGAQELKRRWRALFVDN